MSTSYKIVAVLALLAAIAVTFWARSRQQAIREAADAEMAEPAVPAMAVSPDEGEKAEEVPTALPRLVDLGADKCIPCKAMAPILEELEREYAKQFTTEFIDVWKNPEAGEQYGVKMIPTQIFYDAAGEERFRHTGFFSKEDILGKWKELGVL